MKIPMNFPDAQRLSASLGLSITDCVAQAGASPDRTLLCLREAAAYAHVQARLLDNLATVVAGDELVCDDETEEHSDLRRAMARRGNPPNIANVTPILRVGGDEPGAA